MLLEPYRVQRVLTFLDPWSDPEGSGYHMIQSMTAVSGGEGVGRGLGFGLQKFGYLPEDRNDFLYAVICEELGIVGAGSVIALYLVILWAGLGIARNIRSIPVRLAALGIVSTLGIQAIINMIVVTGLGPTKGIALPLLSSGGTGWIATAASLGLLVGIGRRQTLELEAQAPEARTRSEEHEDIAGRIISRPFVVSPGSAQPAAQWDDPDHEPATRPRTPLRTAG